MDFLTLNLPKSRRGLLLNLSNTRNPSAQTGLNPPYIITDCEGNRLYGRDLHRTKQEGCSLSPTHNSNGMRTTLEKSPIVGVETTEQPSITAFSTSQSVHGTASRDFITSIQSNFTGVGRTNSIFSAMHSQNDRNYRLKPLKPSNNTAYIASDADRLNSTPEISKPLTAGGENRVISGAHGRWSTFFSEEDLVRPSRPSTETQTKSAENAVSPEESWSQASLRIRTSSTFQSDGVRDTMSWRYATPRTSRSRSSFPHPCGAPPPPRCIDTS